MVPRTVIYWFTDTDIETTPENFWRFLLFLISTLAIYKTIKKNLELLDEENSFPFSKSASGKFAKNNNNKSYEAHKNMRVNQDGDNILEIKDKDKKYAA